MPRIPPDIIPPGAGARIAAPAVAVEEGELAGEAADAPTPRHPQTTQSDAARSSFSSFTPAETYGTLLWTVHGIRSFSGVMK